MLIIAKQDGIYVYHNIMAYSHCYTLASMRNLFFFVVSMGVFQYSIAQKFSQPFFTQDLQQYWKAYDRIIQEKDSARQASLLQVIYLDPASEGLKSLLRLRNYIVGEYVQNIRNRPQFWASMRAPMLNVQKQFPAIEKDIRKLKAIYPDLEVVPIYFSVGAFRTGGTTDGKMVIIGAEYSLAGPNVVTTELPSYMQGFFREYKPWENLALLCTHEYIHTQQKESPGNLLTDCLREGIAEYLSCLATGKPSNSSAISFGKANQQAVLEQYVKDLFLMSNHYHWLWGENPNQLKVRDLGYYIGYEIAERYYKMAKDKKLAVKTLIEIDLSDEAAVEQLVDTVKFLPKPLAELNADYEKQRPTVINIQPFANGATDVKPGVMKITVVFSEPLNGYNTGIDLGPLGMAHFPKINPNRVWSADQRSITLEVTLEPEKKYQFVVDNTFRKEDGVRLKPYLVEFSTGK